MRYAIIFDHHGHHYNVQCDHAYTAGNTARALSKQFRHVDVTIWNGLKTIATYRDGAGK